MKQLVLTEKEFEALVTDLGNRFIHNQVRPIIDNLYIMFDKQNKEEEETTETP
jgi:hypothetical protein